MPPRNATNATNTEVASISLTKLHRILRPLRSKCVALAEVLNQPSVRHAISGTTSASRVAGDNATFDTNIPNSSSPASRFHLSSPIPSAHSRAYDAEDATYQAFGHLAYIPHSNTANGGANRATNQDKRITAEIGIGIAYARLGDRIAAVATAFTAVVKYIHPCAPDTVVPSLRSLCGAVIGAQIEVDDSSNVSGDDEGESSIAGTSDEGESAVDQWYEVIPDHLRR